MLHDAASGATRGVRVGFIVPRVMFRAFVFLGLFTAAQASAQASHAAHASQAPASVAGPRHADSVPLLTGLGTWHRRVATKVPAAQGYFDQGLRLHYAFNHAESVRSFREAQRLDPSCVMCAWGEALALGPNINAPMDTAAERLAVSATRRAMGLANRATVSGREAAFVRAIAARYVDGTNATRAGRDSAYATAMTAIVAASPKDVDALALAAEAAMDLSPWNYWAKDGKAHPGTARLVGWLERGMQLEPKHPGACHFYIHAVEAAHPRRAVGCAERLAALMPGAGHIVHMPAHIYIRVGRWADAIDINKHAVHADELYFDGPHTPDSGVYSALYASHNHHFLALAAVMAGNSSTAIDASRRVIQIVTPDVARGAPMVEPMLAIPVQTLVSFGRWDDVLRMPLPASDLRVARAHSWYARGVAFAATGRSPEARATADSIRTTLRAMPQSELRVTLEIAALMVDGEVAMRTGNAASALRAFTEAAALEDGLSYMEPPTWYYPVRHSLGKAQLAAGSYRGAEESYRADLKRFPENGWSLRGLAQALEAQGRTREAKDVERRFRKAWRLADVEIASSRF